MLALLFFFFKQKTAYEMRISDWSSDVCSSDLVAGLVERRAPLAEVGSDPEVDVGAVLDQVLDGLQVAFAGRVDQRCFVIGHDGVGVGAGFDQPRHHVVIPGPCRHDQRIAIAARSEEHTSEPQSPMRTSYAVFCLKKKNK